MVWYFLTSRGEPILGDPGWLISRTNLPPVPMVLESTDRFLALCLGSKPTNYRVKVNGSIFDEG